MSLGPEWKYHITIYEPDYDLVQRWCEAYIGEFDKDWYKLGIDPAEYILYGDSRTTWYFKDEKDVIHFKLRWM
jgi:hypothetical protein